MPKRRALAKQVINKALSNDPKAAALVFDQIRRSEGSEEAPTVVEVSRPDKQARRGKHHPPHPLGRRSG